MKVSELIQKLQTFSPDAKVIISAVDERRDNTNEEPPSEFLDISYLLPSYAVTSREDSCGPVRFKFTHPKDKDAREFIFIEATNQF